VLTESLDRLSRRQSDIAALYERPKFLGVQIETLADREISEIHFGLKGMTSVLFLTVEHEVEIVREIFSRYVFGKTPRYCQALNARQVLRRAGSTGPF
jgi:hypothetical protein